MSSLELRQEVLSVFEAIWEGKLTPLSAGMPVIALILLTFADFLKAGLFSCSIRQGNHATPDPEHLRLTASDT